MNNKPSTGGAGLKELFKGVADQVAHDLVNLPLDAVREAVGIEKESGKRIGGELDSTKSETAVVPVISDVGEKIHQDRAEEAKDRLEKADGNKKSERTDASLEGVQLRDSDKTKDHQTGVDQGVSSHKLGGTHEQKENSGDDDDDDWNGGTVDYSKYNNSSNRGDVMRLVYDGLKQKSLATQAIQLSQVRQEEDVKRIGTLRETLVSKNVFESKAKSNNNFDIYQWLHECAVFGLEMEE